MRIKIYTTNDQWLGNVLCELGDNGPDQIETIGILDPQHNNELASAIANCATRMLEQQRSIDVLHAFGKTFQLRIELPEQALQETNSTDAADPEQEPAPKKRRGRPRKITSRDTTEDTP